MMTTTIKTVIEECVTTGFKFVVMRWPCIHHPQSTIHHPSLRHTSVAAHKFTVTSYIPTCMHPPAQRPRVSCRR
ncbi:hypothetical protein BKA56DRAFT_592514 [Ilyonectria sp. MPI-CAGE-AT-0026]|nr:hypothetical protein BKA56DRAFT_592514 [Ilyonectria sp. MPI-CAGE-AT-0026]